LVAFSRITGIEARKSASGSSACGSRAAGRPRSGVDARERVEEEVRLDLRLHRGHPASTTWRWRLSLGDFLRFGRLRLGLHAPA